VTEWNEFRQLDMARVKLLMRRPVIVNGRNIYDPKAMIRLGFTYRGTGREYAQGRSFRRGRLHWFSPLRGLARPRHARARARQLHHRLGPKSALPAGKPRLRVSPSRRQ